MKINLKIIDEKISGLSKNRKRGKKTVHATKIARAGKIKCKKVLKMQQIDDKIMRKFSGLSKNRKRGKKRACDGSHARSKMKNLRKIKETGTGDNTQMS